MRARGYDHLTTAILLTRLAGSMFIFAPLAGRLTDRLPARFLSLAGKLVMAGDLLGRQPSSSEPATGRWLCG
jgi:hypothetical protein